MSISNMSPNKNKIVQIHTTNGNLSWHTLLSTIMSGVSGASKDITGNGVLTSYDADEDRVYLTINDNYPTFKTANEYSPVVKKALKAVDGFGLNTSGLYDKLINGTSMITGVIEAFKTSKENGDSGGGAYVSADIAKTFNPWYTELPAWDKGASGKEIEYTFDFAMGKYGLWDARQEVVNPIMNLLAPTMPRLITNNFIESPYPNMYQLIKEVLKSVYKSTVNKLDDDLSDVLLGEYNKYTYTVEFGNLYTFYNMAITNSTVNFSTDTDDKGNPISGSITLTFSNIVPPALKTDSHVTSMTMIGH